MNRHPLNRITDEDRTAYDRDGVVCLRGMFDADWIAKMQNAVEEATRNRDRYEYQGPSDSDEFVSIIYLWRHEGPFRDYILESPAAEIVGRVLDCEQIRAFQDHLFIKPKGSPHVMAWHHDMTTWPMTGEQVPTMWLALSPVSKSNGRLEFVKGYHKQLLEDDVIYRANYLKGDFGPSAAPKCPDFNELRDDPAYADRIGGFDLDPGDLVLFHPRIPHGSGSAVDAQYPRIGLSSRWIGDDIRWHEREGAVEVPGMDHLPEGDRPDGPLFPVCWQREPTRKAA